MVDAAKVAIASSAAASDSGFGLAAVLALGLADSFLRLVAFVLLQKRGSAEASGSSVDAAGNKVRLPCVGELLLSFSRVRLPCCGELLLSCEMLRLPCCGELTGDMD